MAAHVRRTSTYQRAIAAALIGAAALTGCSTTKLALKDDKPEVGGTPPGGLTSTTLPGSPEFASAESVKHPERIHLAYGRWQEQQRQPALAREAYQKALDHDPKSVDALLGLARLDQLAGRPAEAEQHLNKAQQLQPQNAIVHAAWGEFFAAQQNWPKAIERYQQAIKLSPDEQLYKHQLAVALVKSGAVNDGFAQFVAIVGQPEAHYNVGVLMYQQGKLVQAEQHLQRALALKPELTPASTMVAKIHRERGLSPTLAVKPPVAAPVAAPVIAAAAAPVQPAPSHPAVPAPSVIAAPPAAVPPASAPAAPVTAATWTAARNSNVQPATYAPPNVTTPQQLEQWRNQQGH